MQTPDAPAHAARRIVIACRCGRHITRPLTVSAGMLPQAGDDAAPVVAEGAVLVAPADWDLGGPIEQGDWLANIEDIVDCHPGGVRNGCCGPDGYDGPNLFCAAGHPVGVEVGDCWTPRVVVLPKALGLEARAVAP